jgi:hypothetical protein
MEKPKSTILRHFLKGRIKPLRSYFCPKEDNSGASKLMEVLKTYVDAFFPTK